MRVLVCGGRDYADGKRVFAVLDAHEVGDPSFHIVQGGARGADALAVEWAKHREIPWTTYPARWFRDGKKVAGPKRNRRMLVDGKPDLVIAFPGGRGTAHMVEIAKRAGVPVVEVAQ